MFCVDVENKFYHITSCDVIITSCDVVAQMIVPYSMIFWWRKT